MAGGPNRIRTDDLLNAIEALFQLSYGPADSLGDGAGPLEGWAAA